MKNQRIALFFLILGMAGWACTINLTDPPPPTPTPNLYATDMVATISNLETSIAIQMQATTTSLPVIVHTATSQPTNSPTTPSSLWPLLSQGSQGAEVLVLQSMLDYRGYDIDIDGDFGPQTHDVVISFQQSRGLSANGYVAEATWKAVLVRLTQGMQNAPVYGLQYILNKKFGYSLDLDGDFGPQTRAAVDSFQTGHPAADHDGTVGLNTWEALLSNQP